MNTMTDKPNMAPYARHLLLCTGEYCDPEGNSIRLYNRLPALLGELGQYRNPCRVKRGTSPCLGVCSQGPIAVVYPDGIWYHNLDEALLQRIVDEHLYNNQPVTDAIFHQLGDNTDER